MSKSIKERLAELKAKGLDTATVNAKQAVQGEKKAGHANPNYRDVLTSSAEERAREEAARKEMEVEETGQREAIKQQKLESERLEREKIEQAKIAVANAKKLRQEEAKKEKAYKKITKFLREKIADAKLKKEEAKVQKLAEEPQEEVEKKLREDLEQKSSEPELKNQQKLSRSNSVSTVFSLSSSNTENIREKPSTLMRSRDAIHTATGQVVLSFANMISDYLHTIDPGINCVKRGEIKNSNKYKNTYRIDLSRQSSSDKVGDALNNLCDNSEGKMSYRTISSRGSGMSEMLLEVDENFGGKALAELLKRIRPETETSRPSSVLSR